ncbi:septum site-determining protein MinC [Amphritea sp. 2_MG-2023]|uniref:septum site-determining protein MinC n=1 Tax=Amphritea TaxID=515417 RepID=UPI001C078B8B|nr:MULTISPECIES: septum site-determining protein MinC [Amphritea]MBU2966178.1 septum site-determining protein MinC [Amphritea atlantica]MDO6420811.1 septum site-determining protein MinC [Amphritea sp. 2_MG-2023]
MADACFQIKGTNLTLMSLDLYQYQPQVFAEQLRQKVESAPLFFTGSPLFLNLADFSGEINRELLQDVIEQCRGVGFQLFGCKGADDKVAQQARDLGLIHLPASRPRVEKPAAEEPSQASAEPQAAVPKATAPALPTRIVDRPVRSGQQIYAEGCDLILLAPVSEGAEVIADGNIHVYRALRGRALAGVRGNPDARIFCQQLEAELVSINGHFILNDKLREHCWKQAAQVYLQDESLQVTAL